MIVLSSTGVEATLMGGTSVAGGCLCICGVGERLDSSLQVGQLVVASELWAPSDDGRRLLAPGQLASAELLAAELRRDGHEVVVGPVVSWPEDTGMAAAGALVRDDGSAATAVLAGGIGGIGGVGGIGERQPVAVVMAVEDPDALAGVPGALERWARACGRRTAVLAAPRSFCAGVERAIEIVERALERFGAPVYVRRQIVHNTHVVESLASKGAVFVEELSEVPDTATVVLAAHGVSPEVRQEAEGRKGLEVIDATCPLVAKVHHEARRYAARGYDIVLVGHADHEEVVGTLGEAPDRIHLVASVSDVAAVEVGPDGKVAYLTQTTLATDETAEVIDELKRRFPDAVGPSAEDICYATQNRQDAVRAIAARCDLVLVVGSANSSNTTRLVEVARREGCRAELVEDAGQLRLSWLDGAETVGLTAGASAPEVLVDEVIRALRTLGPLDVVENRTTTESVRFALPLQVR